jgi:hypothetical protein
MVVGQIVLAWTLNAAHQEESPLRMPKLGVMMEIVATKATRCRQIDALLQPPGHTQ